MKQLFGLALGNRKLPRLFLAMSMVLCGGQTLLLAAPASPTWYGTASTDWNNRTNWTPSFQIPGSIQSVPASGDNITISQGCTYYPVVTNSLTVGALNLNQANGSITISKGTFTAASMAVAVGNSVTISSGATITCPGTVTASGTWTINGTMVGAMSMDLNSLVTINSGGIVNASVGGFNANSGGGSLYIYGTLNNGVNEFKDDTSVTVSGGTLTSGALTFVLGGSLTANNSTVTGTALTVSGGSLIVNSGTTLTSGNVVVSGGAFTITNATLTGGTLTVSGGSMVAYSGSSLTTSNVNISGGGLTLNNATLAGGTINMGNGTFTLNSGASVISAGGGLAYLSGGIFTVNSGATVTLSGALTSYNNCFTTLPGSTVNIAGIITPFTALNISGGNYFLTGGTQSLPSGTFNSLSLSGGGTYTFLSGNNYAIGGNLSVAASTVASINSGVNVTAGTLTLGGAGQINGTWGSTSSTATSKNNTYFAGAGIVTVSTNAAIKSTTTTLSPVVTSTYGGNAVFTATISPVPTGGTVQFQTNGVAFGSAVTVSGGTASLTNSTLPAGSYTITAVYGGVAGFSGSTSGTASQTVNKVTVTITAGLTVNNKVYDHNTSATLVSNNVVLSGVLAGDTANAKLSTNTCLATFARAGIGSGISVTVSGLALTGSAAGNYSLTQPTSLTASITTAPVTIASGITVNSKAYTGTTAATISSNNVVLSGVLNDDLANVKLSTTGYTATFSSAGADDDKSVTVSGLTLTGTAATNYSLTQPTGLTASITALPVTVTSGLTVNSKAYTGTTAATINSNSVVLSGVLAGDTASVKLSTNGYTATFASASAGTSISVVISGLTLTGSAATNYSLTQPSSLTGNITVGTVTISSGITAGSKAYDGATTATISSNNVVLSGVLAGDVANVKLSTNGYTAAFAGASAGSALSVTISGLTLTGTAAANYTLTQPSGLTASITAIPVSIASGITAVSKIYSGTTAAAISSNNVVLSGVVAADVTKVKVSTNSYTATFASSSVGTGISVTVSGLTLTGTAAANYTLAQPSGLTASITAIPVTITSGITAASKAYDGTTATAINLGSVVLSGVVAGDTANVHLATNGYTAAFASATAGTGIGVTVSGLTLTGSAAANYSLTQPSGLTASITAIPVTIASGVTANDKIYNGTTVATISVNTAVLSGVLSGDTTSVRLATNGYTASFASASVADDIAVTAGGLTLTGSAAGNYTLTQPAGLTASITAATVTITSGVTAKSKVYDGTSTATISSNNVVLSGVVAGDAANVKLSTNGYSATFASTTAGTGIGVTVSGLTLKGSAAANYTLTQPSSLTASITAVPVTIASGVTVNSKVYNGNTAATLSTGSVVLNGVVAGDTANVSLSTSSYTATFASASVANGIAVTVGGLTLTGSAAANYTLAQPVGLTASITAAAVTITSGVTVNNKIYNGTTAATITVGTVVLSGVVAGDTANVHLSSAGYTAAFASASVANEIAVTVGGLSLTGSASGNYSLVQPAGLIANITAVPVTITSGLTANSKPYDGAITATINSNNVVLSGIVAADAASVKLSTNDYTASFARASVGAGLSVTVSGLTLTGDAAVNYTLVQPSLSASITTLPVTIVSGITANDKAYNGTTAATISANSAVLSGVLDGDTANVRVATNGYVAAFASAGAADDITVTVSGLTLAGSAAGNYTLTQPSGLTASITPVTVTVASGVTVKNKIYDGNTAAGLSTGSVGLSGIVAGDASSVHLSTNGYTATFASASVGTGIGVTVSGLTLTGAAAGNYTLIQPSLSASITSLAVTIASGLTANNKAYDGNTTATLSANNVALSGVLDGDSDSVTLATNGYTATFASAAVGNGISVTVSGLKLTGSAAANYTLAQPAGLKANITQMTLAITSPTSGQQIVSNSDIVTVAGTVLGNGIVSYVSLSLDGVNWTNATTLNGFTNWTQALPVTAGAQTLQAYAVDMAGNISHTNIVAFTIIHTGPLSVTTSGNGTVSPNYDGQNLKIGTSYTMVATGQGGWTFSNWTSNSELATNKATLTFTMASNLVLTANFVNTTVPTVKVTTPSAAQQIVGNSDTLNVTGTASTTAATVGFASVWVSLDGINWTLTGSANGWSNWAATLPVSAGPQVLRAYAVDATGNYSLTNTVAFNIIHTGPLLVTTNGSGTVSPNYNGQTLQIGQPYTMTATPAANWKFKNWTGNYLATTNAASLKFLMVSNLSVTANFAYAIPPTLSILALTNKQVVVTNDTTTTVKGMAASKVPLAGVFVSITGSGWMTAVSTNGWTNWTALVPISAGPQTLQAYAVDIYGNYSLTNTINFSIAHTGYMTVRTNGNGTVSPNYDNTYIQIGGLYTMQATGRHGWTFTNWTSNFTPAGQIITNNDHITFQMVSNLVITANYVDVSMPTLIMPVLPAGQYAETNISPLVINGSTVTAADDSLVTNVYYSFNSNAWQNASSGNNWTNWTASVVPQPGTNSIRAYAVDAVGNYSYTNVFKFTYFEALPLTVRTNQFGTGAGTITLSTNGQNLIVGTKYFIKAQPATGCVFSNWTSNFSLRTNTATLTFTMVSNLTLYANFLDITRPTLTVTNLLAGQKVSTTPLTIKGVAADNVGVSQVWYSLNSSPWSPADGTTSWSLTSELTPGTNTLKIYSQDAGGNASLTNTLAFQYAVPVPLTLVTNGLGTITIPTGGFFVGQKYSLTAVASSGFTFTNWTASSGPGTNKATLTFTMVPNLVLTANFVDNVNPTVVITSPNSARFTNNQVTVTGTAADNWGVAGVYCQVNSGTWQQANGTTNWNLSLNLTPGTNVIKAYAMDFGNRHSLTSSVTVYFVTAPATLVNFRAVVTPDDGTPSFEMNFGTTTFSQYVWGDNNLDAAGTYVYTNPGLTNGVLSLNSFALPQNSYLQTLKLSFTNRYAATFSYTNGNGQLVTASATLSSVANVATAPVSGQSLESVNALGAITICNFLTNGVAVQTTGSVRVTNNWTYLNYGAEGGLVTLTGQGQTNWTLIHYESVHAGEYYTASSNGTNDLGLVGFVRPLASGNAPLAGALEGHSVLANSGDTLASVSFAGGQFSFTTSDASFTGAGAYLYSPLSLNVGQITLNYVVPENTAPSINTIQFLNSNFGVSTNSSGISGIILR